MLKIRTQQLYKRLSPIYSNEEASLNKTIPKEVVLLKASSVICGPHQRLVGVTSYQCYTTSIITEASVKLKFLQCPHPSAFKIISLINNYRFYTEKIHEKKRFAVKSLLILSFCVTFSDAITTAVEVIINLCKLLT